MKIFTGELDIEDLIRSIIILKNDIEIVLITQNTDILQENNIVKIIYNKENYVKDIEEFLLPKAILKEDEEKYEVQKILSNTEEEESRRIIVDNKVQVKKLKKKTDIIQNIQKHIKYLFSKLSKEKEKPEVILVIGKAGVRKNYIYKYIC